MRLSLSIDYFQDIYGLTCVENQLSVILKYLNLPLQATYIDSFVDLSDTIRHFIQNKTPYAYYSGIDRLQKTAKRLGVSELKLYKISYEEMIDELKISLSKGYPLLVHVDSNMLPKAGGITPWRNDHFISLFGIQDDVIQALDDVPQRILEISSQTLISAYKNEILVFNELKLFNKELYFNEVQEELRRIIEVAGSGEKYNLSKFSYSVDDIIPFRDAICILKISRCRMRAWFKWAEALFRYKFSEEFYSELDYLISQLQRLFSTIEFARLRRKINSDKLRNLLNDVYHSDMKCLEYISTMEIK